MDPYKGYQVMIPGTRDMDSDPDWILQKIESKKKRSSGPGRILENPVGFLTERPENVLAASVPSAILFLIPCLALGGFASLRNVVVVVLLIAIVPYSILDTLESGRVRKVESAIPNFLRDVAGMNETGMTLPDAVHTVSCGDYGRLTPYIRKMDCEMSWNASFVDAICRFGESIGTPLAVRTADLIAKAASAGGDASEVLIAAANDSYEYVNLSRERTSSMSIYVFIVFISFFVFIIVIGVMSGTFLGTMAETGAAVSSSGEVALRGVSFGGSVDMDSYRTLFFNGVLVQAFFSGLVAGKMGEGRTVAGLKYSAIMLVVAWISFSYLI